MGHERQVPGCTSCLVDVKRLKRCKRLCTLEFDKRWIAGVIVLNFEETQECKHTHSSSFRRGYQTRDGETERETESKRRWKVLILLVLR